MIFIPHHPKATLDNMGFFPTFLIESDPRPAREQINERYSYGGGWSPMHNFRKTGDILKYPGDPPLHPICELLFRDERIVMYEASIFMIVQKDGSWEVARCD